MRNVDDCNLGTLQGEEHGDGLTDAEELRARQFAGAADKGPLSLQSLSVIDPAFPRDDGGGFGSQIPPVRHQCDRR